MILAVAILPGVCPAMSLSRTIRRQLQGLVAPSVLLLFTGYFCWQAYQGDRGLQTYAQRQEQLRWAQQERDATYAERDAVERRVNNLRPQHLDPDTLDERVRAMLSYGDPADVIVQYGKERRVY